MSDRKTLDDYLMDSVVNEVNQEMEKEASAKAEVSTPQLEKTSENYEKMRKLAQQLKECAANADTPETAVRDLKDTVNSVENE